MPLGWLETLSPEGGKGHSLGASRSGPLAPGAATPTSPARSHLQVGAADMDGFQADTEEEEEEDGDCMIVEVPDAAGEKGS